MLDLTRQERVVLISFVFVTLTGITLQHISKTDLPLKNAFHIIDSERFYHKIDINRATYKDFLDLPFIGPTTAERIIDYRNEHGPFQDISDLTMIEGVKKGTYRKIGKFLKISSRKN